MSYFLIFFSSHHLSYVHKFLDTFLCQCSANVTGGKSVLMIMFTKVDQGINIKRNVHQGHQVQSELLGISCSPQYPSELLRTHILKFLISKVSKMVTTKSSGSADVTDVGIQNLVFPLSIQKAGRVNLVNTRAR